MLFNSFEFLLFLPAVFCLYWFVFSKSVRWQNLFIVAAGYFFYGWMSYWFAALLFISTVCNYIFGYIVGSSNRSKAFVYICMSVLLNIGILCLFKYHGFFEAIFPNEREHINLFGADLLKSVVLPVGLSFYTLRAMSYIFDVYRGKQNPVVNFVDYALFQSFFPLLLAGPLERAESLMPQIKYKRTFNYTQAVEGGRRIIWGMFKKMVIANHLAVIVEVIFNSYDGYSAFSLIIAAIAFSFQLYADVSGYADIAIGTAKLLGIELSENFRFPYFSRNLIEFWTRWHITLTSWFKDYVYMPIRGEQGGIVRTTAGIIVGFLLMAVWHNVGLNYIVWGLIHCAGLLLLLLLGIHKQTDKGAVAENKILPSLKEMVQMLTTFSFVTLAWVFFRTEDVAEGYNFIKRIATNSIEHPEQYLSIPTGTTTFLYIIPLLLIDWWLRKDESKLHMPDSKIFRLMIYYVLIVMSYFMLEHDSYSFMYFKF